MADAPTPGAPKWGFNVRIEGGDLLDEEKAAAIQEALNKLMPHLVDIIAKAHGLPASASTTNVKRSDP